MTTKTINPAGLPEGTVKAFLIDPMEQTIKPIELETTPGEPAEGYGDQIRLDAIYPMLECQTLDLVRVNDEHIAIVDDEALLTSPSPTAFWQWGPDCQPMAGKAVVCGHDDEIDSWHHAQLTAGELREEILFTRRSISGFITTLDKQGGVQVMRTQLIAPILQD